MRLLTTKNKVLRNIDVDETADAGVAQPCVMVGFVAHNKNAAVLYLKLYDKATAATVGTDTPKMTIPIEKTVTPTTVSIPGGVEFTAGISPGATTGVADNDTGAPGANDLVLNLFYK